VNMNMTERAFVIDKQLQRLLSLSINDNGTELAETNTGDNRLLVSMQGIVNAVVHPNSLQSQQTLKIVNKSSQYVNWYKLVLATFTKLHSPMQVAASSTHSEHFLLNRQGRGFTLKVLQEESGHEEAYLILSLESPNLSQKEKGVFMHCMWEQQFYVVPFGFSTKNENQILISTKDKAFNAIVNIESDLYLT
jgi:hypothetical protein